MRESLFSVIFVIVSLCFPLAAAAELIDIDNDRLKALISDGVPVIDLRTRSEWNQTGIIDGSHLLTFFDEKGQYDAEAWLRSLSDAINPQQPFALICHSGGRTATVGKWLGKQFSAVYNVENGIASWISEGHKVTPIPLNTSK